MKISIVGHPELTSIPSNWIKGELLDVRRYANGSFRITRLAEDASIEDNQAIEFASTETCQEFVSWWYTQEQSRGAA